MGTSLISSYVRIKPLGGDKPGGGESRHRLTGWDRSGAVSVSGRVFDHAAAVLPPDATQLEAYETVARPLVRRWLAGHDVDLLCYGQTGAGKTFTMFGPPFSMARAAEALGDGDSGGDGGDGVLLDQHGFILRSGWRPWRRWRPSGRGRCCTAAWSR